MEELLAERELEISYETVRRWVLKFGPLVARRLVAARKWVPAWSTCPCRTPASVMSTG